MDTVIKVSPEKLEEVKSQVIQDRDKSNGHYEEEIEQNVLTRRRAYESEPEYYLKKFPKLSQISDLTSSDVADTIEWAIPSLMRTFFSGEDVITLQGVTEEDDDPAQTLQELINYQLQRHNKSFMVFHDWFKSSLIENVGIVKCYWDRQVKVDESYEIWVNPQEFATLQQQPGVEITKVEKKDESLLRVEYNVFSIVKNQPVIENIPVSEFRFSPEAKDIDQAEFVAHRKIVTADYLRRKEKAGIYEGVEEAIKNSDNPTYTEYETHTNPSLERYGTDNTSGLIDKARRKLVLYECYTKIDYNDDGLLEDIIVTMVNDTIIRIQENTMGRHPFFLLSPIRDPQKVWAKKGICDLVSQLQDLKTALLRQVIYNIAINNDRQAFVNVDMLVDVHEFIDGKKAVRVQGDPSAAVYWSPVEQLQPQVFSFLEYIEGLKEARTGVTRYNQGMDANTLNKTATGITSIMNASNQRLELIARMFAETGINQLFRHLIRLNQQFIDNNVVIRITNKSKTVRPDDLQGEIDIIVNAGMGTGGKQQAMQNIQMLLSLYPQMIQAGVAGPEHVAYVVGKMTAEMGWKNKQDFCYTPDQIIQKQQQAAMQQQQAMQMQQQEMQRQAQMQQEDRQLNAIKEAKQLELQERNADIQEAGMNDKRTLDQQRSAIDQLKVMSDYMTKMHGGHPNERR
jgi:hypothetical protein